MNIKNRKPIILDKTEEYTLFILKFNTILSLTFLRNSCYKRKASNFIRKLPNVIYGK